MVQDGAGESLRSLCILCASRYDSDKAVTRSRSCMLNPVDPNAVENTTYIKMKYCRLGRYRKLPRLILCVLMCIVCMGLRGSHHMNSSKSMRHRRHRHQVFGNALCSCRQSLLEDSGPRCPIDCDEGAKKKQLNQDLKIHSKLHNMSRKQYGIFSNGFWLQDVAGASKSSLFQSLLGCCGNFRACLRRKSGETPTAFATAWPQFC